jgi:hypothetical protein
VRRVHGPTDSRLRVRAGSIRAVLCGRSNQIDSSRRPNVSKIQGSMSDGHGDSAWGMTFRDPSADRVHVSTLGPRAMYDPTACFEPRSCWRTTSTTIRTSAASVWTTHVLFSCPKDADSFNLQSSLKASVASIQPLGAALRRIIPMAWADWTDVWSMSPECPSRYIWWSRSMSPMTRLHMSAMPSSYSWCRRAMSRKRLSLSSTTRVSSRYISRQSAQRKARSSKSEDAPSERLPSSSERKHSLHAESQHSEQSLEDPCECESRSCIGD